VQQVIPDSVDSDAEPVPVKAKRRRLNLPEDSSTDSKEEEQEDTAQSPAKSRPLDAPPLAPRPSTASSGVPRLGFFALGADPESDEEEEQRFNL